MSTQTMPLVGEMPTMSVIDKTVLLNLAFGAVGNSKKVSTEQVDVGDADKSLVHVSKTLLDSAELQAVFTHRRRVKEKVKDNSLPSLFRSGIHLVPWKAVSRVRQILEEGEAEDRRLVEIFLGMYTVARAQAEERLGDLYDPMDYPSLETVRNAFFFRYNFFSASTPDRLRTEVSAEFFEQEKSKAMENMSLLTQELTLLRRTMFKKLIDGMADALKPDEDGKKKRFHQSKLKGLKDFLADFDIMNVNDDRDLEQLVKVTKTLLSNDPDAQQVRDSDHLRDMLEKGCTLIQQHLDPLVEQAGSRKIALDGDE